MITANKIRVEVGAKPSVKEEGVIYFSSFDEMQKVLNNKRIELLEAIKKHAPESIYELARIVKRDQGNVTKDVNILRKYGFIQIDKHKEGKRMKSSPRVEPDSIEMVIKLGAGMYGVAKESLELLSDEFKGEKLKANTKDLKTKINKTVKEFKE
ncbi:MAG: hypothetical protein ACP5N2_03680 [Candidatus Nanoarchaeia archaeon]